MYLVCQVSDYGKFLDEDKIKEMTKSPSQAEV
jgi:hypothetical protein